MLDLFPCDSWSGRSSTFAQIVEPFAQPAFGEAEHLGDAAPSPSTLRFSDIRLSSSGQPEQRIPSAIPGIDRTGFRLESQGGCLRRISSLDRSADQRQLLVVEQFGRSSSTSRDFCNQPRNLGDDDHPGCRGAAPLPGSIWRGCGTSRARSYRLRRCSSLESTV